MSWAKHYLTSFSTFDSFLAGMAKMERSLVHVDLPIWPINRLEPLQQSRQQVLRAYWPNVYTVPDLMEIIWANEAPFPPEFSSNIASFDDSEITSCDDDLDMTSLLKPSN